MSELLAVSQPPLPVGSSCNPELGRVGLCLCGTGPSAAAFQAGFLRRYFENAGAVLAATAPPFAVVLACGSGAFNAAALTAAGADRRDQAAASLRLEPSWRRCHADVNLLGDAGALPRLPLPPHRLDQSASVILATSPVRLSLTARASVALGSNGVRFCNTACADVSRDAFFMTDELGGFPAELCVTATASAATFPRQELPGTRRRGS